MKLSKLYERLKEKGYDNLIIERHLEKRGGWDATCGAYVRDYLELDRRKVFMMWYGDEMTQFFGETLRLWEGRLEAADEQYRNANIRFCIDYILDDD